MQSHPSVIMRGRGCNGGPKETRRYAKHLRNTYVFTGMNPLPERRAGADGPGIAMDRDAALAVAPAAVRAAHTALADGACPPRSVGDVMLCRNAMGAVRLCACPGLRAWSRAGPLREALRAGDWWSPHGQGAEHRDLEWIMF